MASAKLNKKKNKFIIFLIRLFREKPIGAAGLLIVILFLFVGIFADFIAPHDYYEMKIS